MLYVECWMLCITNIKNNNSDNNDHLQRRRKSLEKGGKSYDSNKDCCRKKKKEIGAFGIWRYQIVVIFAWMNLYNIVIN